MNQPYLPENAVRETEPFGITYDRLRLDRTVRRLLDTHNIKTVLELPAGGAKAMPSIYSLAFGLRGCDVHLFNPEPQGLEVWKRLGIEDRLTIHEGDPTKTGLDDDAFDLVWNFVTVGFDPDFPLIINEMSRVSKKHLMTVHCNGYNIGYPWHRVLHKVFNLPWTHGETAYFFPRKVRTIYKAAGMRPIDFGLFDMPPWPDPPGFRDVRLHLTGGDDVESRDWRAPIEQVYATGQTPLGLRILSFVEDLPIPNLARLPFSHLFYILGEKVS